jgi:site-specific recombinase XerD
MMLEELERRNYAQTTIDCYLRAAAEFSLHFHRPPNQLVPQHIRQYQAQLFRQRKLVPSTVTQHLAALRFFYIKTLRKPWSIAETPYPKKVQRLRAKSRSESSTISAAITKPEFLKSRRAGNHSPLFGQRGRCGPQETEYVSCGLPSTGAR